MPFVVVCSSFQVTMMVAVPSSPSGKKAQTLSSNASVAYSLLGAPGMSGG